MRREWFTLGIHLGYRYEDSPICWPDGSAAAAGRGADYVPTARPGHRAPARLARRRPLDARSVRPWFCALGFGAQARTRRRRCSTRRESATRADDFAPITEPQIAALYERRFVLVRPDGHVAWRDDHMPEDPLRVDRRCARRGGRPGLLHGTNGKCL